MKIYYLVTIVSLLIGLVGCTHHGEKLRTHARWDVKTLEDSDVDWLTIGGLYPEESTTIEKLIEENAPDTLHNNSARRSQEKVLLVVGGWVYKKPKPEKDGDLHLELFNKDNTRSIKVETVNPEDPEVADSRFSAYFQAVRNWVRDSLTSDKLPRHVMITGVRYFDNSHHTEDGEYSPEIHPVLGIRWAK